MDGHYGLERWAPTLIRRGAPYILGIVIPLWDWYFPPRSA